MIIRRSVLQAVLPATTDSDRRYSLDAVNVRPDGTVEATNGSIAILARDKSPIDDADFPIVAGSEFKGNPAGNILIPTAIVKSMIAAMPKRSPIPVLAALQLGANGSETGSAFVSATDLQAPRVAHITNDGTFPAIDRVIPAADKAGTVDVFFAVDVLETICRAARAVSASGKKSKAPIVRFAIPTAKGDRISLTKDGEKTGEAGEVSTAVRVTYSGPDVDLVIAAMPCRG